MKIVQVYQTNPFLNGQGGGVRYVKNLISGIENDVEEILFLGIGSAKSKKGKVKLYPITKELTGYLWFLFILFLKLPFIRLSNFDIIHVHRLYFAIPFIVLKPQVKIICTLHGRTFSVFENKFGAIISRLFYPFFISIERFCLRNVDIIVPVSQDVVKTFESKHKIFSSLNIKILGSMMDLTKFKIIDSSFLKESFGYNNKYILFVGRLSEVKDVEFLICLWSVKFQKLSNYKLIIVGEGEKKESLEKSSNRLCKENIPIFLGSVSSDKIPLLISSSDVCVLASKHEASPTIVKEALSCGIPVVSSPVGDVFSFIQNGQNGFVINKELDLFFHSILSCVQNLNDKNQVLEVSKNAINECTISTVCKKYLDLYNKII